MTVEHAPAPTRSELTAAQRRIWFGLKRNRASEQALCSTVRIDGPLDPVELRAAVTAVLARHVATTSTYHVGDDGEPYRIAGDLEPGWTDQDLRGHDEAALARRIEIIRRRERARSFDLETGSPVNVTCLRTGDADHLLLLTAHAVAWDDDSLRLLLAGLADEYGNPRTATTFAADSTDLSVEANDIDRAYWRDQLATPPIPVEMPGSRRTQSVTTVDLDPVVLADARRYAASRGVDLTALLVAVHSALVLRYTGSADVITALPVGTSDACTGIGQCGNMILLRTHSESERSFDDHVARVARLHASAMDRRGDGIDRVVDAVRPSGTRGADGFAQLTGLGFAVHQPIAGRSFAGLRIDVVETGRVRPQVPWHLEVELDPRRPQVRLTAIGDDDVAAVYPARFTTLLAAALAEPDAPVGRLALLSQVERTRIVEHARGASDPTPTTTVTDLLQDVAASMPEHTALLADTGVTTSAITYSDLNERANRLARYLADRAVGTEDVVGLQLSGSVEFAVALLAVLKAGAAYLPIDPAHPAERRALLLEDAHPALTWTAADIHAAELAAAHRDSSDLTDADRVRPLRPANLAYVMYTSGSTGRPKGVPVAHAEIADHVVGFGRQWTLSAESRVLQTSSVGFDASLLDYFVMLSLGATIVLPDPDRSRDLTYLSGLIGSQRITLLHLVPSLLRELLTLPQRAEWRALTHIAVGGDKLGGEITDRALAEFDVELRNYYGPTEAVVSAAHHRVVPASGNRIEPIGRPNRNVTALVLDDRLELVPDGVPGELYLGGAQLARGYLDRPGQTAAAFVADPFEAGARLYRTGDLVRRLADGSLDFLGRRDDQVKVRGHRVELGEITAVLAGHPDVIDCHVTATTDAVGDTVLAAYLVGRPGHVPDPVAVREFSARWLPEIMVPTSYSVPDALPRTGSAKVDAAALGPTEPVGTGRVRELRSSAERDVAAVFAQFFDATDVHGGHSFFDLGGHSLNAHRMLAALRERLGVRLDVADLLTDPTVAGVAAAVEATLRRQPKIPARPVDGSGEHDVSATAAQELAWRAGRTNVARLTVRFTGHLDRAALAEAVERVCARHDATRMALTGPAQPAGAGAHHLLIWDTPDYLEAGTDPVDDDVSFDIGDRLWRLRLSGAADDVTLSIVAHRAAADDASLIELAREIADCYAGRDARSAVPSFVDYAHWYAACSAAGGSSQDWWHTMYSGLVQRDHSPVGSVRPAAAAHRVDPATRRRLQAVAAKFGVAERGMIDAAVAACAHLVVGTRDVVVGSTAGRDGASSAPPVGPVNGPAIVRYEVADELIVTALLDQARLAVVGADTAPGVPVDVHRATALAATGGVPDLAAAVVFDGTPRPATLDFGGALRADVDGPAPQHVEGVLVECRARDGGLDITVTAPGDAQAWSRGIAAALTAFVTAPESAVGDIADHCTPAPRERTPMIDRSTQ